ncbi:MAG: PAS domain-containing protein [Hydrococcus sp. Prado102]|nr:PAS domain-containing protein [Hydrococcus sp. Prado102]
MDRLIRLEEIIDRSPVTIAPDTLVVDAIALLHQSQTSCILVVEDSRLVGRFTPQDVVRLVAEQTNLSEVTMRSIVMQPVKTLQLEELQNSDNILSLLQQQINHVPVIDEQRNVVGLLETSRVFSLPRQEDSETRLQKLAVGIPGVIYIFVIYPDGSMKFEYMSEACREVQEVEPEEVLSNANILYEQIHPEDLQKVLEANSRSAQTLEPFACEWRILTKSGKLKWVQAQSRPERRNNGEIVWYGTLLDISDRKYIEEQLEKAQSRLRYLLNASPAVIYSCKAFGDYAATFISDNIVLMLGYESREFLEEPKFWTNIIHPEDRPRILAEIAKLHEQGHRIDEYRILHKDGTYRWISNEVNLVRDTNGNPIEIIGDLIDISERKRIEQELQNYSAELEELYNQAPCGYHSIDAEGVFVRINDTELNLLGYTREEIVGKKKFSDFLTPKSLLTFQETFPRFKQQGWVQDLEFQMVRKDGTIFPISLSATALKDATGHYLYSRSAVVDISKRKQAEEALRTSEATLHSFFDSAPVMMGIVELIGNDILHITDNAVTAQFFDRLPQAMQNRFDSELGVPPEHVQLWCDRYREAERTQTPVRFEYFHTVPGGIRWLSASVSAIKGSSGARFAYVVEDISDRKQAEAALKESEQRWQLAIRGNNDGIWDWNVKTNEVFFSPRWKEMLGYEDGEISDSLDEWAKRVHPDDLDWVTQAIQAHFDKKTPFYISEHRVQCKDETYKWILDRGQALWDERGDAVRMVGSHTDITDRKETEEALRASEERFRLLVNRSPVGIFQTDKQGDCVFVNPRWLTMTGLYLEEALGKGWSKALHPKDRDRVFANWYEAAREGREFSLEYRYRTPQGKVIWVFGNAIAIRDETGNVTGYFGTVTDISERKQKEKLLENIARGVSAEIGESFFRSLVKYLTKALELEYAFICELVENRVRTVAAYGDGQFLPNCEYSLENTPCDNVVGKQLCVYRANVQQLFPKDAWLQELGVESYIGVPLFDSTRKALGSISVLSRSPIENSRLLEETLKIFAVRAGMELERRNAEAELVRQTQRSQLFAEIALKIRQSLQPDEILQTAVAEVQKLLRSDRVLIFRIWSDGSGTVVQESVFNGFPSILGHNIDDPCFSQDYIEKYRQGRVSAIVDIETAGISDCHVALLKQFSVKANLVVPIIQRDSCWGLLIAHHCSNPRQWSRFEIELLQELANQIGIALSQARLLEVEVSQREELARSNAELQQFAYVASHDLQEPLRMVTSYLQLLEKRYQDKLDSSANEFITFAVDGANRMRTLINDLLSYSRISTRGQPFESVDIHASLKIALANLKIAIDETGALVTYDSLPQIVADASQLTQLFQNLIANAIKFRRENIPPHIQIGAVRREEKNSTRLPKKNSSEWLFWVRDNGIGIEPQYGDRIFVIFQRLHGRGKYPGTGIGLSESEFGKGSTFYFTLPEKTGNIS